ncbi:hypothetical protein MHYP_G00215690 [Metynnis hypsauchen]
MFFLGPNYFTVCRVMKVPLVLLLVFSCRSLVLCSFPWATLKRWEQWKQQYQQNFSISDDHSRRAIWTHNFELIASHNKDFLEGHSRFTMEMNKFGAMSDLEYSALLGVRMGPGLTFSQVFQVPATPSSLDYRNMGLVTPVKDQGVCGSSWAFGVTGAIEAQVAKTTGELVSLSEQNLVDCSKVSVTYGCRGGWMGNAYEYIQTHGINKEADYPYLAKDDQPCLSDSGKSTITIQGHIALPPGDENTLRMVLAAIGPITVAVDASNWSFIFYKMGNS